jgi:hypothetical protein
MVRLQLAVIVAVALALGACAAHLQPAPGATVLPGPGQAVIGEQGGVRIVASANAWRGHPPSLERRLTPILMVIENGASVPLRLRYSDFTLVTDAGRRLAALPPFDILGTVSEPVSSLPYDGLYWPSYYSRWSVFGGPFRDDPLYFGTFSPFYGSYGPGYYRIDLPTGDMVQKALPETVVPPGGRVAGFLYFEPIERGDGLVQLVARIVAAETEQLLGTITIPFVVDG